MNALTGIGKLAIRREVKLTLVSNPSATPLRAAMARKRLTCRWIPDPESGRLICVWSRDGADEIERLRGLRLAA